MISRWHGKSIGSHVDLKAPQILRSGLVWGAAEKSGESPDRHDISLLGASRETANRYVLDHAPAQRADGSIGHDLNREHACVILCWDEINKACS
jgi:hypothetical protein